MVSAIIVAGGSGRRMGGELPKQFMPIEGTPILMRVVEIFALMVQQTIVVLPEGWIEEWRDLCATHHFTPNHTVVAGGVERFDSVRRGIEVLDPKSEIVLIHDGVRPFVSSVLIERIMSAAREHGTAVPAVAIIDTIRSTEGLKLDRRTLRAVQTPQGFSTKILRQAYAQCDFQTQLTDDSSVVELAGHAIHLVQGESENIKITTPFDIKIAQILW